MILWSYAYYCYEPHYRKGDCNKWTLKYIFFANFDDFKNQTIFNIICWVAGDSSSNCLIFQALFFLISYWLKGTQKLLIFINWNAFAKNFARNYEKECLEHQMLGGWVGCPLTHWPSVLYWKLTDFRIFSKLYISSTLRGLSQITYPFFGIFWPRTPLVCTFYVVNYTFFWPPTQPKCKHNLWKLPNKTYPHT